MKYLFLLFLFLFFSFPIEGQAQYFDTAYVCVYNLSGKEITYKITFHNAENSFRYKEFCTENDRYNLQTGKALRSYCANKNIKGVFISLEFLPQKMIRRKYQKVNFKKFTYEAVCTDENSLTIGKPVDGGYEIYQKKGWE